MTNEHSHTDDKHRDREFRIKIDREHFTVDQRQMTGAELRALPNPPVGEKWDLYEAVPGSSDRLIGDNDVVKIRNGQRFFTAPRHINPGMAEE